MTTLLATEPFLTVDGARQTLTVVSPDVAVSLRLRIIPGKTPRMPGSLESTVDPTPLLGKDGRPAEIVLLGEASRTEPR